MKDRLATRIGIKLGLLAVAGLAVMAIAGPSSASAAGVVCASNLDGDPNIAGRQCPNGFEYGANNPIYSFSAGNVKVKLASGTSAAFTSDVVNITCNRSIGNGRIADSGAGDGVPNGFLFSIDWEQRTGGVNSEQCPTNLAGVTANGEPIETNTGPGIWDIQGAWLSDGVPPTVNGTMTLLDVKASVNLPQAALTCFIEGDTDGDGTLNEGDRALVLDVFNPGNLDVEEELVESAPQSGSCPDTAHFSADYVLKGNTDDDGNAKFNDNLFIRQDDGAPIFLDPSQEVSDVNSPGFGYFTYSIAGNDLCYTLDVRNLTGVPNGAHIHPGPRGVAGPIAVGLITPPAATSTVSECITASEGGNLTPAELAAIAADPDSYYVNVHTPTYTGGEIRGQLE
jgi:CHRD domain